MNTDGLLNEIQGAMCLGVRPSTMRKWRREGRISFVKLGACVRYRRSDLDAFILASLRTTRKSPEPVSEIEGLASEGIPTRPQMAGPEAS